MSESQHPTPPPAAQAPPGSTLAALPWYGRPVFWGLLLFLALLFLAGWLFWKEWQNAERTRADVAAQTAQWSAHNASLEAFVQQLRALLAKDPCDIQKELHKLAPPSGIVWPPLAAGGIQPPVLNLPDQQAPQASAPPRPADTAPPSTTPPQQPDSFAALMEQATVLVLALREEGLSMGSGFFVAPGFVATNAHVVGSAAKAVVVNKATGKPLAAVVRQTASSNGKDFALLAVEGAAHITPLKLSTTARRTERVSAWGFPGAVTHDDPKFAALLHGDAAAAPEVVYTDGVVSVVLERAPALIVHTATVSQGNSGGPLVNENGDVVGINTFIKLDDESYRQSSLAIVSASLAQFLRSAGVNAVMAQPAAGGKP